MQFLNESLNWINGAFSGNPKDVRSWVMLEPLLPHAIAVSKQADEKGILSPTTRLFNQVALLLLKKAKYAEAEPLMRRALEMDEKSFGKEHPEVATDLNNLASLLRVTNRIEEAEPLMRRAFLIFLISLGFQHPSTKTVSRNYRTLRKSMGDGEQEIEEIMRKLIGST